jgi:hypothetical protein
MSLATFLEASSAISDFVGKNLCRPGWIELAVVLVLLILASTIGCCCGVGWGFAAGIVAGNPQDWRAPAVPRGALQLAKNRLARYAAP